MVYAQSVFGTTNPTLFIIKVFFTNTVYIPLPVSPSFVWVFPILLLTFFIAVSIFLRIITFFVPTNLAFLTWVWPVLLPLKVRYGFQDTTGIADLFFHG